MLTPRQAAEAATFQSFANCYLREIDAGTETSHRIPAGSVGCIEWYLPTQHAQLRAEITSPSLCGPQHFGRIWTHALSITTWRQIEPMAALHLLVHESYRRMQDSGSDTLRGFELELLVRVLDSYQQTALFAEKALPPPQDGGNFIEAEQSLVFGHWQHPTPKSRQGMTFWQQEKYAPELRGRFKLHYFAAHKDITRQASAGTMQPHDIIQSQLQEAGDGFELKSDERILPMHPLQAEALLLDPDIQALQQTGLLRYLGPAGAEFTATSSVRTVYNSQFDWMYKFSLPVRITNSVRLNRRHELDAGVAMSKLMRRIGFSQRSSHFRIIHDPAFITIDLPDREESGFEAIFRENLFREEKARGVITIAALTADPLPGHASRLESIVRRLATRHGDSFSSAATQWFQRYLDCAIEPLIRLYDDFGIALEAHQQNTLLDIGTGYPTIGYYRDNQGFYLSEAYRNLLASHVPETETIGSLYFPDTEIRDRFAYYIIVNQVFSVISRLSHDGLCDEADLLFILRDNLERYSASMTKAGRDFARHVLDLPTIASKANLGTRLFDVDELQSGSAPSLYRHVENPLALQALRITARTDHAIAS